MPFRRGFTLVEMSLVLVIIGLVIGGILVGTELVKAAELRSLVSDVSNIQSAINTFRSKYGGLPGDLRNATDFWATAVNGNNNGQIDYLLGGPGEEYYAWQHLGLANLVSGNFTGASTSLPKTKLNGNAYYRLSYQTGVYGKGGAHMISVNAMDNVFSLAHGAMISPKDLYSLDKKMDDGLADSGQVMGFNEQGVAGCATHDYTFGSGSYLTSSTSVKCKIFFLTGN